MRNRLPAVLLCLAWTAAVRAQGVEATWGLDVIDRIANDSRNVVLPILDCRLDGFVNDWAAYRTASVRRSAERGGITATVPVAGEFYPAFIFYDASGDERIGLVINGVQRGVAAANADDNRQRLFFLTERVAFKPGDTFELRALTSDGAYRTENLLLLREKPQPRRHEYLIRELFADARSGTVTWITNWPAACTVEWSEGGPEVRSMTEEVPLSNHRVALPGRPSRFRVTARTREGALIATEWRGAEITEERVFQAKGRVPLRVEGVVDGFPVTGGVPFPRGTISSDKQLRLLGAKGEEAPLQTRTLGRWDDGSLKWALLDFQAAAGPYWLEYGAKRRSFPSELKVTETSRAVTVDTGPLRFTISRERFGLFESASLGGRPLPRGETPAALYLTGPDGTVYTSLAAPDEVVVEESGPLRAVVRVSGEHRSAEGRKLFAYVVRIHAYAGRSYVRLQHTFINNNGAAEFTTIKSLGLKLPLRAEKGRPRWALPDGSGAFDKRQRAEVKQRTAGNPRAVGWAEWRDGAKAVTVAVRDFWQNYPKDLAVTPEGIDLWLCPPLGADEYAAARGTMDEHRLYYYSQGGGYKLRQGVSKTHDIWIDFQPAGAPPSAIRTRRPLFAAAPPEWYAASKAFGTIALPQETGIIAQYDEAFRRSFEGYLANRENNREYGMLNFGDWWGERIINWGNSEYDTQHAFLLHFARTGDLRVFHAAEEMEWHNRDVDTIHFSVDKTQTGAMYAHAIGHTGGYYKDRPTAGAPTPAGFSAGSPSSHFAVDHTFIEGHLDYYFLTGDQRSLETAKLTADRYVTYFTRNYDFSNCRQPGWHLILAMAMYNATYDRFYLNAAKIIIERVLERQTADGGWRRQLTVDHCQCVPRHHGNTGFMVGVLLTGLRHYYEATGDERVAESIVKASRFLINDMWMPEARAFRYTSCPRTRPSASLNFLLFDGLVFAHKRANDPRIKQVLIEGTESALAAMRGWGKGFTQYTRVAPAFIEHLAGVIMERGSPPR